jgi:hypothetical protein
MLGGERKVKESKPDDDKEKIGVGLREICDSLSIRDLEKDDRQIQ